MNGKILLLIPMALAAGCNNYDLYQTRSEISDALADRAVSTAKIGVMEFQLIKKRLPADLEELSRSVGSGMPELDPAGPIGDLRIEDGTIILTLSGNGVSKLKGQVVAMAPCIREEGYESRWACGHMTCPAGTTVHGPQPNALTTLSAEVMPASCR